MLSVSASNFIFAIFAVLLVLPSSAYLSLYGHFNPYAFKNFLHFNRRSWPKLYQLDRIYLGWSLPDVLDRNRLILSAESHQTKYHGNDRKQEKWETTMHRLRISDRAKDVRTTVGWVCDTVDRFDTAQHGSLLEVMLAACRATGDWRSCASILRRARRDGAVVSPLGWSIALGAAARWGPADEVGPLPAKCLKAQFRTRWQTIQACCTN
jgi:hypothetical protein